MRKVVLRGLLLVYCYTLLFYYLAYFTPLRSWALWSRVDPVVMPCLLLALSALTFGEAWLCARRFEPCAPGIFAVRLPDFSMQLSNRLVHRGLILLLLLDVAYCIYSLDFVAFALYRLVAAPLEAIGNRFEFTTNHPVWLLIDHSTLHQLLLFLTAFFFLRTRDRAGISTALNQRA